MGINIDAIRNRLNKLNGQTKNRTLSWKPKEGEDHTVRLISFGNEDGTPFKDLYFYYNIGSQRGLLAPYQFGKPDPIQELITKLRDDKSKESYELAKKLYPKMRTYAPVIVRGEEDKGVQIWGFGKTVCQGLYGIMLDEDYGDITDPLTGRDIKVICTKQPGKKWAMTEVRPRGKESKLSSSDKQAQEWINNIPNLDDMFELKSYDELSKIVNDWIMSDEMLGDTGDDNFRSEEKSTGFKSLDDAFASISE